MNSFPRYFLLCTAGFLFFFSCAEDDPLLLSDDTDSETDPIDITFDGQLDLADPFNYATQAIPDYIARDNTENNRLTDAGATLGRVLFYDSALSSSQTISCASCHQQSLAFGDVSVASTGVAGTTERHSMRLINARFGDEERFFWDERSASLEAQTTEPIRDHVEMGFSGNDGDPSFDELLDRLNGLDYYGELFSAAYGSPEATEERIAESLAQFIRSIQSFDSKYDEGRAQVNNNRQQLPNFTAEENRGMQLFLGQAQFNGNERIGGGLNCGSCHEAPEFSIDPQSGNNGVTGTITGTAADFSVTRSPTLRDLYRPDGSENGPFMHDGSLSTIDDVLDHYNNIPAANPQLDRRLRQGNQPQRLNLTADERSAVVAFLKTLSGSAVYSDERWSNPFID
ncbi:cytochrome-c peroxidase [Neolewinella aurantiaca]|nr:cytochrome c peroxidase [Neolewinella aurantiaca]